MLKHIPTESTFQIEEGTGTARLEYNISGKTITINRTFVPPELRGQGVATRLAEAALKFAEKSDLSVRSNCTYIDRYLERRK